MSIFKIPNVPLIPQPTNGVCWYASSRMLYVWSTAANRGAMKDPAGDAGYRQRFLNNGDVDSSQNWHIAQQFNMQKYESIPLDYDGLSSFLSKNGPIWAGVKKN